MSTKLNRTFALALCLSLAACSNQAKDKTAAKTSAVAKTETFALQRQSITANVSLPAELSSFRQVELFAKLSSYVKTLKVDIGSEVKQGQLLIELEAPEISSQLAAAQSRLHAQEAIFAASNGTYQRIFETSKTEGTISKNDLEVASSRKSADQAQLEAARAAIKEIKTMQGYLEIHAPFDGKVTARNVNIGAFVNQGSQIPLLTVQDHKKLRLAISVPEAYTGYLHLGDQFTFNVVSIKGESFKAKVSRMSGALDPRLRAERVELDVTNDKNTLLPGMVAEVKLPIKRTIAPFVVPKSAVMTSSEGVFVIRLIDRKIQWVKVETGMEADDQIEIFSDQLKKDDLIVTKANEELREGSTLD